MAYISDDDIKAFQSTLQGIEKRLENLDSKTVEPKQIDTFESIAASENFLEGLTKGSSTLTTEDDSKATFECLMKQALETF